MKKLFIMALVIASTFVITSCFTNKGATNKLIQIYEISILRSPKETFLGLNKGLSLYVQPQSPVPDEAAWKRFFASTSYYVKSMGFNEISSNSDYKLYLTLNNDYFNGTTVFFNIDVSLKNERGIEVFNQNGVYASRQININEITKNPTILSNAFNEAYTQALEQINWNRIASFLRTEQLAKDEPQKQVQGLGDTALEQTIIRWDVQSRPQGADILWRVVSKTPDVKSTNNKYLMTTPYEATKALDIRGLTYQTSGNVRIILRCEKDGYLPQEKEFDVRMVLDQEEISAFFRLVKEE